MTLNRPESLNAINSDLATEFIDALDECSADEDIRAVLIRGAGRAFCAGDDVGGHRPREPRPSRPISDPITGRKRPGYWRLMGEIRRLPKPVIAAVHGYALGAGCDVAMACDFRIVADNARFGLVFVKRGITGGTWMIEKHLGLAKATELLFTGEQFDALEAQRLGLVTKLVTPEALDEESLAYANKLASGPTKAIGFIKAALNRGMNVDVNQGMELNITAQNLASQTEDVKEGRLAFQERRDPVFQGR